MDDGKTIVHSWYVNRDNEALLGPTALGSLAAVIDTALAAAVAAEREACAKLCDELSDKDGFEGCYADACAQAIRARSKNDRP